ncbi:cytochrome P450 CYP72A219-like protein [Salvia divinorum]|uniref:Cytochrome P450 CYP72A219-like protein n=1 Tax=Salvia divinorum TaxID=28513 RepID=A0ABD1HX60_SALDI
MLSKWDEIVGNEGSCEVDSIEEGRKIFELQREQMTLIVEAAGSLFIPGWRFLPTKFNRRMKEIMKEIESSMLEIIDKKRKAMATGEASGTGDLLGLLLESNSKEMKKHGNESGMSIKEVIEDCKIFYFAGQETNSSLLVWTVILLSKYQDWQIRARDEVTQVFGRGEPGYQDLNHLKIEFTTATIGGYILHEALRLYPLGATFTRSTHTKSSLGKLRLPAELALQVLAVHHDTRLWGDDASVFNPERFGEGVSKATQGKLMFLPFGLGPRVCLGQKFAMLEAKMAMVMILQRYSLKLLAAYTHAPYSFFTLQPQHGAHLILTKL